MRACRAAGVDAQLGFDTAFAYRMGPGVDAAGRALMDSGGVRAERAVLLSVREFDAMYPQDGALFEARMATLITQLAARGHQPAVIIQAQAGGADADQAVVRRLQARCPQLRVLDPFAVAALGHHPLDALVGALGLAAGVVAVRYHTAVLRMIHGRAPFNLYYSSKGRDLIERLGTPGMALEHFEPRRSGVGGRRPAWIRPGTWRRWRPRCASSLPAALARAQQALSGAKSLQFCHNCSGHLR